MNERFPHQVSERKENLERFVFAVRSLPSENHPSRDEDSYISDPELGLAAVFDGVGGRAGGDVASRAAARSVQEGIAGWDVADEDADEMIPLSLVAVLNHAHEAVVEAGRALGTASGEEPATTASVVKVHAFGDGRRVAYIANVGDSRVYVRHANGELEQLSQDHDLLSDPRGRAYFEGMFKVKISDAEARRIRGVFDQVEDKSALSEGLERTVFDQRNVVTTSLGDLATLPDVRTYCQELAEGDIVLLTSDGVHDNLTAQRIQEIVSQGGTPEGIVQELAQAAYEYAHAGKGRAKKDDITVAVIKVR